MKRKYLNILFLLLLISCNKDNKKQYSTWYVNGEMFRTNDVELTEGKVRHIFGTKDIMSNGFNIEFYSIGFPTQGNYLIGNDGQPGQPLCSMTIINKGIGYMKPKGAYLRASINNKKFRYTLEPTWFYNESDPNDSILVKGEFNEP